MVFSKFGSSVAAGGEVVAVEWSDVVFMLEVCEPVEMRANGSSGSPMRIYPALLMPTTGRPWASLSTLEGRHGALPPPPPQAMSFMRKLRTPV